MRLPAGQERSLISIRTSTPWGIDLVSEIGGAPMQFWDGSDPTRFNNGIIDGGPGVWRRDLAGWTDRDGKTNQASVGTAFSVFDGRGGQVVIDAGNAGAIQTGGMQFAVTGYTLSGSGLRLAGNERTVFRVGDGSEWASTMTAEIAAPISGHTRLVKNDAGTLILSGDSGPAPTNASARALVDSSFTVEAGSAHHTRFRHHRLVHTLTECDALRLGQGNVARRKVDVKNIAENKLHGASLRPNHQINTPGVGCYLLLKLTVADQQNRCDGNAKRQKKNIQRCIQRPGLQIIPYEYPQVHRLLLGLFI